jgi:hypothetical protein
MTCLVGVAALLAAAPTALASPGDDATLVVEHRAIPAGGYMGVTVDCGPQRRAIGGGAASSADPDSNLLVSGPLDTTATPSQVNDGDVPRYWWSVITNGSGAEHDYSFYATCSSSSDATLQAESFDVPGFIDAGGGASGGTEGLAGIAAPCPSGQRAIGGGLITAEAITPSAAVAASGPLDESGATANTEDGDIARFWYAAAVNDVDIDADPSRTYTTVAVCSAASAATVQVTPVNLALNSHGSAAPRCPAGSRALGGGAVAEQSIDTRLLLSNPTDVSGAGSVGTGGVARGWSSSSLTHDSPTGPVRFSAICEPEPASAGPGATGQRAAALKKCKKKHGKKRRKCKRRANRLPV